MGKRRFGKKFPAKRKFVLRRDASVGNGQREIERVFGLPEGSVRFFCQPVVELGLTNQSMRCSPIGVGSSLFRLHKCRNCGCNRRAQACAVEQHVW